MDDAAIILRCLDKIWPAQVSMIGEDLVARIINDALDGKRTKISPARGGHNFDLTINVNILIDAALVLIPFIFKPNQNRPNPPPNVPHSHAVEQLPTTEEQKEAELLEKILALNIEYDKAYELVRFINSIQRD